MPLVAHLLREIKTTASGKLACKIGLDDETIWTMKLVIVEGYCETSVNWTIGLIERREFLADENRGAMKSANNC
jgi:hypothetical protein